MIQETLAGCREKRQEEREDNGEGMAKPVTTVNNWSLFPVGAPGISVGHLPQRYPPRELDIFPPTVISDWLREIIPLKFQAHLAVREPSGKESVVLTEVRPGCIEMVACVCTAESIPVFPGGLFFHLPFCTGSSPTSSSPSESPSAFF